MNTNQNHNPNQSYLGILEPLVACTLMPKQETITRVTLTTGDTIKSQLIIIVGSNVTILSTDGARKHCLVDDIALISTVQRTIYPDLPPTYTITEKSDTAGWIKSTLRAVLSTVNANNRSARDRDLVLSVQLDASDYALRITVSSAWASLPQYVRSQFVNELWRLYKKLIDAYHVSETEYTLLMYSHDNSDTPIVEYSTTVCFMATSDHDEDGGEGEDERIELDLLDCELTPQDCEALGMTPPSNVKGE